MKVGAETAGRQAVGQMGGLLGVRQSQRDDPERVQMMVQVCYQGYTGSNGNVGLTRRVFGDRNWVSREVQTGNQRR